MQPKSSFSDQGDLFRSRLDQILNRRHQLYHLADSIDWSFFDREFGSLYTENFGRPGLPIRLLVGLHYLKHAFNVSDESVVDQFLENPYWQYFCGFEFFQHEFPLDPTTLVKWRKRLGPKGMEKLLQATIETGKNKGYVCTTIPPAYALACTADAAMTSEQAVQCRPQQQPIRAAYIPVPE